MQFLFFNQTYELHISLENSESLEMHIFSGGSKLQIARSQLSDSGTYSCVASNVEGKARKSYHLTIQGTTCTHNLNHYKKKLKPLSINQIKEMQNTYSCQSLCANCMLSSMFLTNTIFMNSWFLIVFIGLC